MRRLCKSRIFFLFAFIWMELWITYPAQAAAKYVFLFIGDGMGAAQRSATEMYLADWRSTRGDETERASRLVMNTLPAQGFIRTNSLDGVTDSAAAGTALASGQKTKNGSVAMDSTGKTNLTSIAVIARKNGMKTGIVTSAFLQDATPAAFYGHAAKRSAHYALGLQLAESGFEYFAGGGFRNPTDRGKNKKSLLDVAREKGYRVTTSKEDFLSLKPQTKAIAINPKLRSGSMPFVIDQDPENISLADFVRKGIELLENERGFFMLVEGGNIDIACHANDIAASIRETIALDRALEEAMKFYRANPGETLIVAASDHETGGLTISAAAEENRALYGRLSLRRGSCSAFERTVSPGKGSFAQLLGSARKYFGEMLSETDALRDAFQMSMLAPKARPSKDRAYARLYGPYDPFTVACAREADALAGVSWSTFYHTGKPVPISAVGVGSALFSGEYENTEVFSKLRQAMEF